MLKKIIIESKKEDIKDQDAEQSLSILKSILQLEIKGKPFIEDGLY